MEMLLETAKFLELLICQSLSLKVGNIVARFWNGNYVLYERKLSLFEVFWYCQAFSMIFQHLTGERRHKSVTFVSFRRVRALQSLLRWFRSVAFELYKGFVMLRSTEPSLRWGHPRIKAVLRSLILLSSMLLQITTVRTTTGDILQREQLFYVWRKYVLSFYVSF